MAWVTIVMMIIEALIKLPALIEAIKGWLEAFRRVPNGRGAIERAKFGRALRQALDGVKDVSYSEKECPVQACAADLKARYPA